MVFMEMYLIGLKTLPQQVTVDGQKSDRSVMLHLVFPKGQSLHPNDLPNRIASNMLMMHCCILLSILKMIVTDYSKT